MHCSFLAPDGMLKCPKSTEAADAPQQPQEEPRKVFFGCHFELDGCMPAEEFRTALVNLDVEVESRLATMRAELLQLLQESSEALRQDMDSDRREAASESPRRGRKPRPAESVPSIEAESSLAEPTPRRPNAPTVTPAQMHLARLPTDRLRNSAERMGIKAGGGKSEIIAAVLYAIQKQHRSVGSRLMYS
ncbi:unnamed protein product [Symbiodinium natans]|uniref:Uncharacterized protein n=1 Tax=Symbiodinium natans TaxID=878477 RepID=A0A812LQM0_9DINO|nr:unnamed protein product [Symbiodinium natans]